MKVLEWSRLYNGQGADEYPQLFQIQATSLSQAIELASNFPVSRKKSSAIGCYPAFEENKTFKPEDGVIFNTSSQTAAFILVAKEDSVGGSVTREAVFALRKDIGERTWLVKCVAIEKFNSKEYRRHFFLKRIERKLLYSIGSNDNFIECQV